MKEQIKHTHTHTYVYIYIYMYTYMICVYGNLGVMSGYIEDVEIVCLEHIGYRDSD